MKKHLIRILCIFIILLSTFALTIINTNSKIENQKNYKTFYSIKKNFKEIENKIKENLKQEEKVAMKVEEKDIALETTEKEKEEPTIINTSTKNESVQDDSASINTNNTTYGTFGRLYVANYNVAVYNYNVNTTPTSDLQTIVDNEDSAAYYLNHGKLVIADHYYQGFGVLANLNEEDTSYIEFEDGSTIRYRLIKKSKGINTGLDLTDTEGNSFFDMDADIIMYTCYEDGIMVTLWVLA